MPSAARPPLASHSAFGPADASLSAREREVLRYVVDGASNDQIGARLGISSRTVESHLRRLFDGWPSPPVPSSRARALREGWLEAVG